MPNHPAATANHHRCCCHILGQYQHVEAALDALTKAHAELIAAQALTVTTPIADMLHGVNAALAAHLAAELAAGGAR